MKKIIVGMFSLTLLFIASYVFAGSVTWNTASNDCKTVSIANHETREGFGDPCWPGTTISARPGDSVNVRIYYHNTGSQTATNTKVLLDAPTINNKTTRHSFTGRIVSDQGSSPSFNVYVNLTSAQRLTLSSVNWYTNNQSITQTPLLYGQTGNELIGNGLAIGSISAGWSTQGSVVVAFRVENPQPTGTITAATNSCQIQMNQSTCPINFTWNTQDPVDTSVVKNNSGVIVAYGNNSSQTFNIPFNSATYTLFNNNMNLDSETVSATCAQGSVWNNSICAPINDCVITSFTANPTSSSPGDSVVLNWTTNYCSYMNLSDGSTNLSPNGSKTVWPTNTTTYNLTGFGETSVQPTRSVTVVVGSPAGAPTFPAGAPMYDL